MTRLLTVALAALLSVPAWAGEPRDKRELREDICQEYGDAMRWDCPTNGIDPCITHPSTQLPRLGQRWYDRYHEVIVDWPYELLLHRVEPSVRRIRLEDLCGR